VAQGLKHGLGVEALPAARAVVAGYVAELADPPDDRPAPRVATITRRLAAIGEGHKLAGHQQPPLRSRTPLFACGAV